MVTKLTFIPPLFLSWKCRLLFTSAAYIQVHFRLIFFIDANNMAPNVLGAVPSGSILFAIPASKEHKQTRGADDKS